MTREAKHTSKLLSRQVYLFPTSPSIKSNFYEYQSTSSILPYEMVSDETLAHLENWYLVLALSSCLGDNSVDHFQTEAVVEMDFHCQMDSDDLVGVYQVLGHMEDQKIVMALLLVCLC